jgi:YidC/Oxa1 family membrane protein insertase
LLDQIYGFTKVVAGVFGGTRGNYGVAIILLTIAVRMMMFPLSRKQAQSAKRMQDLQPQLLALKEKYKDDKEQVGRATLALYQKNGVNPFGGCLLVLIQMPIFLGLWQTLNNSVALRHADFLWIRNLAAPDQLFKFPGDMPFLGPYFNLLPFVVIGLMLVQTKLFSPPATTPEQQQQQSMMKWMLIFMMMMFYKVPSGLGLYFIMSSTWSIGERLLLPKITKSKPIVTETDGGPEPPPQGRGARRKPGGPGGPAPANGDGNGKPPGWRERLRERLEKVIEEAEHQKTARNAPQPDRSRPNRPAPNPRRPKRGGK